MYGLFHILMTKTNYDQSENFKRIEKKIEKSSVNATASFDQKYTCLSILLATSNYRVRGTCVPARAFMHELLDKQV